MRSFGHRSRAMLPPAHLHAAVLSCRSFGRGGEDGLSHGQLVTIHGKMVAYGNVLPIVAARCSLPLPPVAQLIRSHPTRRWSTRWNVHIGARRRIVAHQRGRKPTAFRQPAVAQGEERLRIRPVRCQLAAGQRNHRAHALSVAVLACRPDTWKAITMMPEPASTFSLRTRRRRRCPPDGNPPRGTLRAPSPGNGAPLQGGACPSRHVRCGTSRTPAGASSRAPLHNPPSVVAVARRRIFTQRYSSVVKPSGARSSVMRNRSRPECSSPEPDTLFARPSLCDPHVLPCVRQPSPLAHHGVRDAAS